MEGEIVRKGLVWAKIVCEYRDHGWDWTDGVGVIKDCCLSCSARCTINLLIQVPFILPMRRGCALRNSGCLILRAEILGLFSFSDFSCKFTGN